VSVQQIWVGEYRSPRERQQSLKAYMEAAARLNQARDTLKHAPPIVRRVYEQLTAKGES
jgi:hypothetical protein